MKVKIIDNKDNNIYEGTFEYIDGALVEGKYPSFHFNIINKNQEILEIHFDDINTDKLNDMIKDLQDIINNN